MSQATLFATPLYESFDNTDCTFLSTVFSMGHLFDLYCAKSIVDGLDELLAVPSGHEGCGPLAMESTLCNSYSCAHPLGIAYELAKAKHLI